MANATPIRVRFPTQTVLNCLDGTQFPSATRAREMASALKSAAKAGMLFACVGTPNGNPKDPVDMTAITPTTGMIGVDITVGASYTGKIYIYDGAALNQLTLA